MAWRGGVGRSRLAGGWQLTIAPGEGSSCCPGSRTSRGACDRAQRPDPNRRSARAAAAAAHTTARPALPTTIVVFTARVAMSTTPTQDRRQGGFAIGWRALRQLGADSEPA
jgi:hypothetical protein